MKTTTITALAARLTIAATFNLTALAGPGPQPHPQPQAIATSSIPVAKVNEAKKAIAITHEDEGKAAQPQERTVTFQPGTHGGIAIR